MTQKEFKEIINDLKTCISLIEDESYNAFKTNYYVSNVYKKTDEDRIKFIEANIDSMICILYDIQYKINPKVLRHVRN